MVALPSYGNLLIELLKSTALVSLITLSDLTFTAQTLRAGTLDTGRIFGLALLLYFVAASAIALAVRLLERRAGAGWWQGRAA
jgi:polar amino acid transport system permease protein